MLGALVVLLALATPAGESIYKQGTSAGGAITATMAGGDVRVAASVVPCASCHGAGGRGGSEGGVVSPDIRWATLSKPYAVTTAGGRRRAPYTKRLLTRAIAMGIDSAGNTLGPVMPRYQLTGGQMDALIGYLQMLDDAKVPGVSDDAIRVGVVLPPAQPLPGLTEAYRAAVNALFTASASVYGRRIEPVFVEPRGTAAERAEAVRKFVRENDVLALAPAFTDGAEEALAKVADEEQIPLLASMTARPASSAGSYRWVRDLYAGTVEQARLLARYAVQQLDVRDSIAVVAAPQTRAADAAVAELKDLGVTASQSASWLGTAATVIFLGDDALLQRRGRDGVRAILAPAVLATPSLLGDGPSATRVFLALPTTLRDVTPEGRAVWNRITTPSSQYRGSQLGALAAARLLVYALERAGREVTRESLLRAIDGVKQLDTGFSPPLTFSADRHIGSVGAWIVEATAEEPAPVWVEP